MKSVHRALRCGMLAIVYGSSCREEYVDPRGREGGGKREREGGETEWYQMQNGEIRNLHFSLVIIGA